MIAPEDRPLEAHLDDGRHVIVAFTDSGCRTEAADLVAEVLVLTYGSERELAQAIREAAGSRGFACSSSPSQQPTVMLIGSG